VSQAARLSSGREYVPIMLKSGWIWERYYGWTVLEESERLKVLRKRRAFLTTSLVMSRGTALVDVEAAVRGYGLIGPMSIATFIDLDDHSESGDRVLAGTVFKRVATPRWLGVGTLVFDLADDLDTLFRRMAPRERTKCRKAERDGLTVRFSRAMETAPIESFRRFYGRMARERGLERISRRVLDRMLSAGRLLVAQCLDPRGRTVVVNLIYLGHDQGYFLHGARAEDVPDGAGHLTQWMTVKHLKGHGLNWYDLGLLASRGNDDGIYRFKKSLGAEFVHLGTEYRYAPPGVGRAYASAQTIRRALRRL
jgi:hypothetical protein